MSRGPSNFDTTVALCDSTKDRVTSLNVGTRVLLIVTDVSVLESDGR